MYVKAIIKNREGQTFSVDVEDNPKGTSKKDAIVSTIKLSRKFQKAIKKYANKDHALVEIRTDNPLLYPILRFLADCNVVLEGDVQVET